MYRILQCISSEFSITYFGQYQAALIKSITYSDVDTLLIFKMYLYYKGTPIYWNEIEQRAHYKSSYTILVGLLLIIRSNKKLLRVTKANIRTAEASH